mmetsp:Transcript_17720/g.54068  ORF Transcript_17720/g.54068 Transcript_17720/m.54068 type:complete len:235 (+) Transcript_17720:410-1114(+)
MRAGKREGRAFFDGPSFSLPEKKKKKKTTEKKEGEGRRRRRRLGFFAPLVFLADLGFFLGGEVVDDVEGFADFLGGLALDHGGDGGAGEVEERLDVHVVRREDQLEEEFLVDVDVLGVPLLDDLVHVGGLEGFLDVGHGVFGIAAAELDDFREDVGLDVRQRNFLRLFVVVRLLGDHRLHELRHFGDAHFDLELVALLRHQVHSPRVVLLVLLRRRRLRVRLLFLVRAPAQTKH